MRRTRRSRIDNYFQNFFTWTESNDADSTGSFNGGFEGNQEMLARYVGRDVHKLPLIAPGLKYNRGAGLRMALEVSAGTAGSFDGMHCELVDTRSKKPDAVIWGHNYGIVVNKSCQRLYDEGQRHLFATFEMIALDCWKDQNMSCYFVTDDPIMQRFKGSWVYDTTEVPPPEEANTIEELAEKLGLDAQQLKRTVTNTTPPSTINPLTS
ncbi:hypothetical protein CLAFUW4_12341 [Fulvia fulva]|uniref:Uncharacterized protein n=1 Tax=Passalora fulva TaxID=5499 RepID=A0A9Q8PDL8_PASFU|nr:uncharacterized protein CLAFUR5_11371 [Fulvia fulva]KAK4618844.1 hypothetical protein CLAFUR0_12357 [Fulvia fulva]UJO20538.1 hypothetical protein CLAFUR5_11371 [Fulvia fulva]WPV18352.1 hypothetical protein CLAFUW4_12341 [Fulvia fulva]